MKESSFLISETIGHNELIAMIVKLIFFETRNGTFSATKNSKAYMSFQFNFEIKVSNQEISLK